MLAQIPISPAQNLKAKMGIHIALPERLIGILLPEPKYVEFKLKSQKTAIQSQKFCFDFINTTFDTTIKFSKNELIRILMLIKGKGKEIFKFLRSVS